MNVCETERPISREGQSEREKGACERVFMYAYVHSGSRNKNSFFFVYLQLATLDLHTKISFTSNLMNEKTLIHIFLCVAPFFYLITFYRN